MPEEQQTEFPIINAHTHVFTKDHTPKYIAKRFIPWPFYWLLETTLILPLIKKYLNRNKHEYTYSGKMKKWNSYKLAKFFRDTPVINLLHTLFKIVVWIVFLHFLIQLIKPLVENTLLLGWLCKLNSEYIGSIIPQINSKWNTILLLFAITLLYKEIRLRILKSIWSRIQKMIGKEKLEFLLRYINIIRFAGRKRQANNFNDLEQQYPKDSKFVILPMDMEEMGAGPVKSSYLNQMQELLELKENNPDKAYPFIFIDPRRVRKQSNKKPFLNINTVNPNKLCLNDCLVKDYFDGGCVGIKIYPALGYYPFDKELLSLWLYCSQNNIPITTHCSVGPIFYRGKLKSLYDNFDRHPIFKEIVGKDSNGQPIIEQLRLNQLKNKDFQKNFTHPLNYLCLLHEPFLIATLEHYDDENINELFGYNNGTLARNLSNLKINLAHYGGSENWDQFLEQDRYQEANAIINEPTIGLDLTNRLENLTLLYDTWHHVDWFSIISSMILNFDNLYTDISYTVHDLQYLNLLSEIMANPQIKDRVLFGTDFYVVSNHKTEKQFWMDMKQSLGFKNWTILSHHNPKRFLNF